MDCRNMPQARYHSGMHWIYISVFVFLLLPNGQCYHSHRDDVGTLAGDVQNWAILIQNYILQLASDGIKREYTQSYLDTANYTFEAKDGMYVVQQVKTQLEAYFRNKRLAAGRIAEKVVEIYDKSLLQSTSYNPQLRNLPLSIYHDSDIPSKLPDDLQFVPYFKQRVSLNHSTVKISDEVPRDYKLTIDTVAWTAELEDVFKENKKKDPLLRWQYFGSMAGMARIYPGREWDTNFAGFYNDYDPRVRPWYIGATSGPKDVIIILDCSLSMKGEKFTIAQGVARAVINTLTKQDYLNVVCARASHWDEVGKWHYFETDVMSCQQGHMVPATNAHRKDLIEKIENLKPGGTSELEKGFDKAFELLSSKTRTGCQSLIVFVTDGKDTDGEQVRCGPGYYTRSGYVPGPVCKYNWTKVWDLVAEKNKAASPKVRIFSYLTKDDGELFPGKLACDHDGSMKKLYNGENLISQMVNYFEFLSSNSKNTVGLWTSPYLDAWGLGLMLTHAVPCVSKLSNKTIGVAGVDATLDEIESFLSRHQWGTVYSFLMNQQGETIFHPKLKPAANLLEDPIFIPITQLEVTKDGEPREFSQMLDEMQRGRSGSMVIQKSPYRGNTRSTYYYAALNDSEYAFAFNLADTDRVFRRSQEPNRNLTKIPFSYFNMLKEYNSPLAREKLKGVYECLKVYFNENKYPNLRVTYLHSSIFLAPKCHCDPLRYFYDDNLAQKTVDAHQWINGYDADLGCEFGNKYEKGIRADVLITQPIEEIWKERAFESLRQVKWTYVGLRSGVFRTYPGHRSRRLYDPTKRSWYKRALANPDKTVISTAYMDAAGVGKIITISQAVFEGMTPRTEEECLNISKTGPWPGGCKCIRDENCIIGVCYDSVAPGPNKEYPRCATERVEAVTSLDILYNDFHNKTMETMQSSDFKKSCGLKYPCPDGEPGCETRCYLFDQSAMLITDPEFITANNLDESKYKDLTMGKKEGEVMKELIYKHGFFQRRETIDFQGSCGISPYAPKATLSGIPSNPEEQDNYYKNKGPIPKFANYFGCIQDVVGYRVNASALGPSGMITGNVSGPCMSGFYYVTALPKTNLFLLVIENWKHYKDSFFYNFNCKIAQSVVNSGAYRIINGTCAHQDLTTITLAQDGKCPALRNIVLPCTFNSVDQRGGISGNLLLALLLLSLLILTGS